MSAFHKNSERIEAVKRYAEADRSDPFAFNRAMTHMKNGVCSFLKNGGEAFYDAEEYYEERFIEKIVNGERQHEAYNVKCFKNIKRP